MKVCLICVEIFGWGKYGGFGSSTRLLGRELQRRGVTVTAVVPRRGNQKPVEELDGFQVLSFPMHTPWTARDNKKGWAQRPALFLFLGPISKDSIS